MSRHQRVIDVDARDCVHDTENRARGVLDVSRSKTTTDSRPGGGGGCGPGKLDISNLFGCQSYTLPSQPSPDRMRRSMSPRPSFDPVQDDMQSTRKSIAVPMEEESMTSRHVARTAARNRQNTNAKAQEMGNRSGARAVAAQMNGSTVRDISVNNILAGSRSERVRRLSQVGGGGGAGAGGRGGRGKGAKDAVLEMLERDENNFIPEIPMGFQPTSPPTCEAPVQRRTAQYTDSAKIPIELDDFGGEGYLLKK